MQRALRPHPDTSSDAVARIEVEFARSQTTNLTLRYIVFGTIDKVRLPTASVPYRADALWQHTCFEAFLRDASGAAYYEFNFAPSMGWAAYAFSNYRSGMKVAGEISTPSFTIDSNATCYSLRTSLELYRMGLPTDASWGLGLSAVIEETNGHKSFWALAHPPGKPDFHHSDCFAIKLPAASHS